MVENKQKDYELMIKYEAKNEMFAKVVAHSKAKETGIEIVTVHLHYPRCIHSEIMTHRVFSRNARSSRAVPIAKMIDEIKNKPFIPWHFGKNQKGMQATEECTTLVDIQKPAVYDDYDLGPTFTDWVDSMTREDAWLLARDKAVEVAEAFMEAGYHKQIVNRLLEPFMWIDTLVTSTDWANFYALRDHNDAEPHFHDLAVLTKEAIKNSKPNIIDWEEYHLPYITKEDKENILIKTDNDWENTLEIMKNVSAARCARISYTPFDGVASIDAELERASKLLGIPSHSSPFEHQARPDWFDGNDKWAHRNQWGNFYGWIQHRHEIRDHDVKDKFKDQFQDR